MTDLRNTITCAEALQPGHRFDAILDVRSEAEFAEDHIPGAVNCPVLNDAQRAEIGTLHKQVSTFEARRRGAALVARNIARHLETLCIDKPREWRPLVYCWRGGQRSAAMAHVLNKVGWAARQLEGGYKAFRRHVVQDLTTLPTALSLRVVCGTTGSGKSLLLQQLAAADAQVLDLEQLAHHRGSVLGGLPALPQPSQKMFETRIWRALRSFDPRRPVFVESESRKVGNLRVPDVLIARMREAPCLRVELPIGERVRLLRREYAHYEEDREALLLQLDCLVPLYGREKVRGWQQLAADAAWDEMVEALLHEHYDPAYLRSIERNFVNVDRAQIVAVPNADPATFAAVARDLIAAPERAPRSTPA